MVCECLFWSVCVGGDGEEGIGESGLESEGSHRRLWAERVPGLQAVPMGPARACMWGTQEQPSLGQVCLWSHMLGEKHKSGARVLAGGLCGHW